MTDRYAVVGNPIGHSRSPQIHAWFAEQTVQDIDYRAELLEPGRFAVGVDALRADGVCGLNVTVPFKEDAYRYAERLSQRAEHAGAVNTLIFGQQGCRGDNTDGVGLVRDLANLRLSLRDRRLLLLGAGGAARGVLRPLLAERPAAFTIANRTAAKAQALAASLDGVEGCGLDELSGRRFDAIINATAAGLNDQAPPLPDGIVAADGWCYDMMYGAGPTAFVRWAEAQGGCAADGLGMLVEQAAESFYCWRGVRPQTAAVIARLRDSLSG